MRSTGRALVWTFFYRLGRGFVSFVWLGRWFVLLGLLGRWFGRRFSSLVGPCCSCGGVASFHDDWTRGRTRLAASFGGDLETRVSVDQLFDAFL